MVVFGLWADKATVKEVAKDRPKILTGAGGGCS